MTIATFARFFGNWSDLISVALLSLTVLSNGLNPSYPLWGFPLHKDLLHFSTMATLIVFSAFRYILEAVHSAIAPREFLTISVLYFTRWLFLYYTLHWSSNLACRFARVAKGLSRLHTLRAGRSSFHDRRGQHEVVVRKGVRKATGTAYWRGVIEEQRQVGSAWIVYLLDDTMHMDLLSPIASTTYARDQKNSLDDIYRRVYECVMTVEGADETHVDWSDFLNDYSPIKKTNFAIRAGATADSELAGIARRIAADACNYVSGRGDFRTETQIQLVNLCVEKAAQDLIQELGAQEGQ